jgi:hypothetical protein
MFVSVKLFQASLIFAGEAKESILRVENCKVLYFHSLKNYLTRSQRLFVLWTLRVDIIKLFFVIDGK